MGDWGKEVKNHRNRGSDSDWYMSLRTEEKMAGLSIKEFAELPATDVSFWFTYDELIQKSEEDLADINDWKQNPMAALPAWMVLVSKKIRL